MKKAGLIIFVVLSLLPLALALNLEVKKIDKGSVIIKEIGNPSTFDFLIKNNGDAENAEIYSLLGILMSPRGRFDIPPGESTLEVKVYPNKEMKKVSGFYIFEYQIIHVIENYACAGLITIYGCCSIHKCIASLRLFDHKI